MARRDDALGVTGVETMIGAGVVMDGNLDTEGDIAIDGTFTGTVKSAGDVTLGVNAQVKGNVSGRNVTVAGNLRGNITAEDETVIRASGSVRGDITTVTLAVESGGGFLGRSQMQLNRHSEASTAPAEQPENE